MSFVRFCPSFKRNKGVVVLVFLLVVGIAAMRPGSEANF